MANTVLEPIKPDYSKAWVRGYEQVTQEGTSYFTRLREERGWTREQVYELTDWMLDPATQALIEGDYGIGGIWDFDHLYWLAVLYDKSPGDILNEIYEEKGRELLAEEAADTRPRCAKGTPGCGTHHVAGTMGCCVVTTL